MATLQIGPQGRHVAWLSRTPTGSIVTIDGIPGKAYPWIAPVPGARQTDIETPIKFSPDGQHVAYVGATPQEKSFVVLDGREGPPWIEVDYLTFSPDNIHLAYSVRVNRSGAGQAWMVVVDGPDGMKKMPATGPGIAFSADGKHMAYCTGTDWRHQVLMLDDKPVNTGSDIALGEIMLSPDGKRIAYGKTIARQGGEVGIRFVCDGVESAEYDQGLLSEFSPDSSKFVCIGLRYPNPRRQNEGHPYHVLAINGKEIGIYGRVDLPVFSADGKRMAFRAVGDAPYAPPSFIVADGVQEPPFAEIDMPVFSPDGKHLAYSVASVGYKSSSEAPFVVVDGVRLPPHSAVFTPAFSPDSAHLAYRVLEKDTRARIVLDGVAQGLFDRATNPVFSPDSKHVAYCAMRGKQAFLLVDGNESEPFDTWCGKGTVLFDSPTHVCCVGLRNGMIVRVNKAVP